MQVEFGLQIAAFFKDAFRDPKAGRPARAVHRPYFRSVQSYLNGGSLRAAHTVKRGTDNASCKTSTFAAGEETFDLRGVAGWIHLWGYEWVSWFGSQSRLNYTLR
jgi:hypothetical protein